MAVEESSCIRAGKAGPLSEEGDDVPTQGEHDHRQVIVQKNQGDVLTLKIPLQLLAEWAEEDFYRGERLFPLCVVRGDLTQEEADEALAGRLTRWITHKSAAIAEEQCSGWNRRETEEG